MIITLYFLRGFALSLLCFCISGSMLMIYTPACLLPLPISGFHEVFSQGPQPELAQFPSFYSPLPRSEFLLRPLCTLHKLFNRSVPQLTRSLNEGNDSRCLTGGREDRINECT